MIELNPYDPKAFRDDLAKFLTDDCEVGVGHPVDYDCVGSKNLIYYSLQVKPSVGLRLELEKSTTQVVRNLCIHLRFEFNEDAVTAFIEARMNFMKQLKLV